VRESPRSETTVFERLVMLIIMNICPHCKILLTVIPEPEQAKIVDKLRTIPNIKFIVPVKGCHICKWNRHFGRPLSLKEIKDKLKLWTET